MIERYRERYGYLPQTPAAHTAYGNGELLLHRRRRLVLEPGSRSGRASSAMYRQVNTAAEQTCFFDHIG
jgi:hypothetical protein